MYEWDDDERGQFMPLSVRKPFVIFNPHPLTIREFAQARRVEEERAREEEENARLRCGSIVDVFRGVSEANKPPVDTTRAVNYTFYMSDDLRAKTPWCFDAGHVKSTPMMRK